MRASDRKRLEYLDPKRLEQTEYHSRRLAKMGIPADEVIESLVRQGLSPAALQEVSVIVNRCYHEVREAEAAVLEELFRAEHESTNLTATLHRFTLALRGYARADEARMWFPADVPKSLEQAKSFRPKPKDSRLLESSWKVATCWSVPLGKQGVLQLGFRRVYPWLPRERELLRIAADRCLAAAEKTHLIDELAEREGQLRALSKRMLEVEELERRRIGQEIHDEAGQSLLCIRLNLEMLEAQSKEEEIRTQLRATRHLAERTVEEIRRILASLNPEVIETFGLSAALRQLATRFRSVSKGNVEVEVGEMPELSGRMPLMVYRLAQECLSNATKHSEAKNVKIHLEATDETLRLKIQDDGKGFDPNHALRAASFGLAGMRERVALLGGRMTIQSKPQSQKKRHGTTIRIDLPIGMDHVSNPNFVS